MIKGLILFSKSIKYGYKNMLLYSVSIGMSVALVLAVRTLSQIAFNTIDSELDAVMFNGLDVNLTEFVIDDIDPTVQSISEKTNNCAGYLAYTGGLADDEKTQIFGVDTESAQMLNYKMVYGSDFSLSDIDSFNRVCIVSTQFAEKVYKTSSCVGRPIRISIGEMSDTFSIIGVYESGYISSAVDYSLDKIYVPVSLVGRMAPDLTANSLLVKSSDTLDAFLRELDQTIGLSNVVVTDLSEQRAAITKIFDTVSIILDIITWLSIIIAVFSLFVIMLINVKQSFKEIGLKKSLGASSADILCEYAVRSVLIALIGTVGGTVFNALLCVALSLAGFSAKFELGNIALTSALVLALAAVFGLIPAIKASRYNPIDTLRME